MKLFIGLDVSLAKTAVCVVNEHGEIVKETEVASEPEALWRFAGTLLGTIVIIGLEAGPLSQWLHRGLTEAGLDVVLMVTAPLLPRRLRHYSADKVGVIDEVIKEFVPGFGGNTSSSDHILQFFDPVIGERGDFFAGPEVNADDVAICEVGVVGDDSFEKLNILAQHFGDVVDDADIGHRSHQAASEWAAFSGAQFHGSNSSSRLTL